MNDPSPGREVVSPTPTPGRAARSDSLSLDGIWQLRFCEPGEGERLGWQGGEPGGRALAAEVPGMVHTDLLAAGLIDEPLYARNTLECEWVEEQDWWYQLDFEVEEGFLVQRSELVFDVLDTTADIWLNGAPAGSSNNAFVPFTVDVTDLVRAGENRLVVRLDVGLRAIADRDPAPYSSWNNYVEKPRMWIRKPQFVFGLDFTEPLLTCGIAGHVELRSYSSIALRDKALRTSLLPGGNALVEAELELESFAAEPLAAGIALSIGPDRQTATATLQPGEQTISMRLEIEDPELWWPAPLGEPALHDCEIAIEAADGSRQHESFRYGLREITVRQEDLGEEGTSFTFVVNGEPVFCKGSGWQPADAVITRAGPQKLRELVRLAAEANFNMLRLHGIGIAEHDAFYDACDEHGIMVWQEFMYGCSYYPDDDPAFVAEARREAELMVRRLRNRTCVAIWCANNENEWHHDIFGRRGFGTETRTSAERLFGEGLYYEVLPEVCARLDPTRFYWPGSPLGGEEPNSQLGGDRHVWEHTIVQPDPANRNFDPTYYLSERPKFVTEFGCLSPSNLESLHEFLPPEELEQGSPSWKFHENDCDAGMVDGILAAFWRPDLPLPERVQYGQFLAGTTLALATEHWRRRKFLTSGVITWGYTDCRGTTSSWSLVDYYLRPLASYWHVRRAFAPVLPSLAVGDEEIVAWVVNDTLEPLAGTIELGCTDTLTGEGERLSQAFEVGANEAMAVAGLPLADTDREQRHRRVAWCRVKRLGEPPASTSQLLALPHFNRVELPAADFDARIEGEELVIEPRSYVWQAKLVRPRTVEVGDDHFDLLPGEEKRVRLRGPRELFEQVTVEPLNRAPINQLEGE